ncbi:MAG TPA: hypothetical protein VFB06_27565 [Streptosporangiaceae bacterium]|nr:hypothetical protein [Streptosporangiaceae bacterium]
MAERRSALGSAHEEYRGVDQPFLERSGDPRRHVAFPLVRMPGQQRQLQGRSSVAAEYGKSF